MVSQHRNANGFYCTLRCANRKESQKLNFAKCQGRGQGGGHNFLSLFYVSTNFKRIFFEKNRRTLFGSLKCRQTLFNAQILFYKDFYDFFRFTRPSPIVNGFPSFAMDLRVANWRPTYLDQQNFNFKKSFSFLPTVYVTGKRCYDRHPGKLQLPS